MNLSAQRRFDDIAPPNPENVRALASDHPAITEARTIFPSTVVDAKDSPRLLISGHNNKKIGKEVAKGPWAGMPIYTLTLEERASCPTHCHMFRACYGNAMQWARRHRHGDEFEAYLAGEVLDLADEHPQGFVVRLHVLGDFYSRQYVYLWRSLLERFPELRVYGYTARSPEHDAEIASAIYSMNSEFPDRCAIRFSSAKPQPMGATVITRHPEGSTVPEGLVCPAETQDSACCASCGLCWSPSMRDKTIVFVQHGMGASSAQGKIKAISEKDGDGLRPIRAYPTGLTQWNAPVGEILDIIHVAPTELFVDEKYQRALSPKSARLITKICLNWDWRKFTPPRVAKDEDGRLCVLDGQHTAIAAASHPRVDKIPVIVTDAKTLAEKAGTFIGINRDRIAVTQAQIFYAEIAAGDEDAIAVKEMCDAADIIVLRQPPARNEFGPGETMAIVTVRRLYKVYGSKIGQAVLEIMVKSGLAPVSEWGISAVTKLVAAENPLPAERIIAAIKGTQETLLAKAYAIRAEAGVSLGEAAAQIIEDAAQ